MSHALTLALVYALVMHAACLLHAATTAWAAVRQVPVLPSARTAAPLAVAVGMALAVAAVTPAVAGSPVALGWLRFFAWAGGSALLLVALLAYEATRTGRLWRAMGANGHGLIAIGVDGGVAWPFGLGLALAAAAGLIAPPPAVVDWLPLAGLALLVLAVPDRPHGRAPQTTLLAWLVGALIGGLELVLAPLGHAVVVGLSGVMVIRLAGPQLADAGVR